MNRRLILILICIAMGALELWSIRQRANERRAQLRNVQASGISIDRRIESARGDLDQLSARVKGARRARNKLAGEYASAVARVHQKEPESAWAEPPASPEWNSSSPFVWISKGALTSLEIRPFGPAGEIDPRIAESLALSPGQQQNLSAGTAELLERAQQMEIASAQVSTSSVANGGVKITLTIPPAPNATREYENGFDALLRSNLSPQQHEILRQLARGWVSEHLARDDSNPNTYSVESRADGTLQIQRSWGKGASSSVSGNLALDHYIPKHLMPFFVSAQQDPAGRAP